MCIYIDSTIVVNEKGSQAEKGKGWGGRGGKKSGGEEKGEEPVGRGKGI
jgi:hypothetical protein